MAKKQKIEKDPLQEVVDGLHKKLGEECLRRGIVMGAVKCDAISTRCIAIDAAIGVGGLPRGRVIEIFGPESSGKTTLALTVVAEAQARGGVAAMIDVEHALDPGYTAKLGVKLDELYFSQPDTGEQAIEIVEALVESNKVDVIVVDSVAALTPKAIIEGGFDEHNIGAQAALMSKALARLKGKVRKSRTVLIFTNQLRDVVGNKMPGSPTEKTPGGRALKFYCSVRIDIRRIGSIAGTEAEGKIGNHSKIKVIKNKVAAPFREATFEIMFGRGIDIVGSIVDMAVEMNLITKNGGRHTLVSNKQLLGQSRAETIKTLENDPVLTAHLDKTMRDLIFNAPVNESPDEAELDEKEEAAAEVGTEA